MIRIPKLLGIALLGIAVWVFGPAALHLPSVLWHARDAPTTTAMMRYRAAEASREGKNWEPSYVWVPLGRIAPSLQAAVIAGEDSRFYQHRGFDMEQIRTAWEDRGRGERLRGASTITQQTVKNLYLSPRRSFVRKAREAVLTAWMELWVPKRRILELYLNVAEFGPGIFGAEAASRRFFGHPAATLSTAEAALLAATLPAPLLRNPAMPSRGLYRRQRLILARMERWYGGRDGGIVATPSDSVAAGPAPASRIPSEPLELPPPEDAPEDVDVSTPAEAPIDSAFSPGPGDAPDAGPP